MRIGVVTTSYPREPGDPAGAFVAGLARWLAAHGDRVEVIAAGPGADRDGDVTIARVSTGAALFYGEGAPDRLERAPRAWRDAPVFAAALADSVARASSRWDAVISHWIVPCGVVAAVASRTRARRLAIAHSGDVHLAARIGVADAVAAALARSTIAFAGAHLRARFLGAIAIPALRRAIEARSIVSPMGVDVAALRAARAGDRDRARRALGVDRPGPLVAALARLVPIKGVHVLVDAMPLDATLVVGGDGPEREALAARASAAGIDARFPGELRGELRDALFCAADVIVVPSIDLDGGRTEGTPTVVLEALAAGVPLVASDVGGVRAVAEGAATLVPPGSTSALARAIVDALRRPTPPPPCAAARFDWDEIAPALRSTLL